MALIVLDRVRETSNSQGTGDITLAGAVLGYQSFADIGNGNTTYYCIAGQGTDEWEVGIGTYDSGTTTLQRTTVLANSSDTAPTKLDFSPGAKDVFVTYPADKSVDTDTAQTLTNKTIPDINGPTVLSANSTSDALRITQTGTGNALVVEDSASPDATPFVIDADGRVIRGTTASISTTFITNAAIQNTSDSVARGSSIGLVSWVNATASSPSIEFAHSRSGAIGTQALCSTGDILGQIFFTGDDGTSFIRGAQITGAVDGTPGTNDMPGRLVFSTTPSGSATPTEVLRLTSAGAAELRGNNNGITTGAPNNILRFLDTDTTTVSNQPQGRIEWASADPDATAPAAYIESKSAGTSVGGNLIFATSPLSGTASEVMRIRFDGGLGLGSVGGSNISFYNQRAITGSTTAYANFTASTIQSDVTSVAFGYRTAIGTAAASFTVNTLEHYRATQSTLGAGSAVTTQIGFRAENSLTGATNNYGFYSDIAAGTGRWNFYANNTAANYFAGQTLIGNATSTDASVNLLVSSATGSATPVPSEVRIQTTTNASDYSTTLPWGRLSFYNSDSSGGGPKIHAAIETIATSTGSASILGFSTNNTTDDTLTERARFTTPNNAGVPAVFRLSNNSGLSIARTAVTAPAASDGNVFSGTYTPTLFNTTNIDASTSAVCQYMRVGNVVTVSGEFTVDPAATGTTSVLGISLPVSSSFVGARQAGGTATHNSTTVAQDAYGSIFADTTNNRLSVRFTPNNAANHAWRFTATYLVA